MKLAIQTNAWGNVVGHPVGVTSIKDLFYTSGGLPDEAIADIRQAGYSGIEMFDGDLTPFENDIASFKQRLAKNGLELVGIYSGANFIFPDVLDEELWRIRVAARLAAEAGAIHLVVGGGAVRAAGPTEEDYVRLAEGLDHVVDIAAEYGLIATFHPHLGTIAESPEQIEKVLSRSRIGFCPDMAHLAAGGGDPAELIRRYGDRMPYVHLKDFRPDPFEFLPLGAGELDMQGIVRAVKETGYDGWIVVEFDGYSGDPKGGAITSKQFLESLE